MKRILLIASRPLANDGLTKIEMDVIRYNQNFASFEVACCFGFDNNYGKQLQAYNIKCHLLPNKNNPFAYMKAIMRLVKKGQFDSVYIHGNSAMMFLEAIPSKVAGSTVITHCHNTKSNYPVVHYLMKPIFNRFVDKKIGCSSLASEWAYCGKNIITIPNGIELEKFEFNEDIREQVRKKLGWCNKKVIGHIGRFNKQKNHMKLIGIFDELHQMDPNCRLLLIGDGELRSVIETEISRRQLDHYVELIDFTDRPQDYMQAMDIMIMPSLFEGLCLVAVEAQANGLPVLIDNAFSPETNVTEQSTAIDLSLPNKEWAKQAVELMKKGRKDVAQQIKNKKMSQQDMLESISKVLTEQL